MSSFIISKKEYIKAAGLMYGIEETKRDRHQWFLDNVRQEFEHCYALNVASVNEQYGDNEMPETANYDEVFESYRKLGVAIYEGPALHDGVMKMRDLRVRLWVFFRSVLYQIENDAAHRMASQWFLICISKLYENDLHAVEGWWGEVEIDEKQLKAA